MINLIKDINKFLSNYILFVFLIITILGGFPAFAYYINSLPTPTIKCSVGSVTFEDGTKSTIKNCSGKITVQEDSK